MSDTSALLPVSEAVAATLNVPALRDLGVTVWDEIPADSRFPTVGYTVTETQFRSMSQPGKAIELRMHIFTQYEGLRTAQQILKVIVDLIDAAAQTAVDGWQFQWSDYLGTMPMPDEIINGQLTQHLQGRWMLVVTEAEAEVPEPPQLTYAETVAADGATHHWQLDDTVGTTAVDLIGGANGTIQGAVTLNQPGIVETAMAFNGISTAISADFDTPAVLSFEVWLKRTGNGTGGMPRLCSVYGGRFEIAVDAVSARIRFGLRFTDATATHWADTGYAVPLNEWMHIVAVWDGTWMRIYTNGIERYAANTWAGKTLVVSNGMWISLDGGESVLGLLDEVAIYPTALTPAQIADHYALGSGA